MAEDDLLNSLESVYYTHYTIGSSLNYGEPSRYCQTIDCEIQTNKNKEGVGNKLKPVGKIEAFKLLVGAALNEGVSISDVFDAHQITMDIGSEIFDFEEADFNNRVRKYYKSEFSGPDVLILSRMEILPEFRGLNVGKRAIKDLYNNFISGCGLMALRCFPLQHESSTHYKESAFGKSMLYDKLEVDDRKAFLKLRKFYMGMGFKTIPGIDKSILVYNPSMDDEFDDIILDE